MLKTWFFLFIFSIIIQCIFAYKKFPHYIGGCIPLAFLVFAFYIACQLTRIGMNIMTILAFLFLLFFYFLSLNLFIGIKNILHTGTYRHQHVKINYRFY